MNSILIVAYGNPLRSDDGVAWKVAEALEGKFPPQQVEILTVHQLAPELADTASLFHGIFFIDAAPPGQTADSTPGQLQIEEIRTQDIDPNQTSRFSHALTPRGVLALTQALYHSFPEAFSITITGQHFDHGESLSPSVATALPELAGRIEQRIQEGLSSGTRIEAVQKVQARSSSFMNLSALRG